MPSRRATSSTPSTSPSAFLVDHIGYAKVLGMFRAARGSYSFDEATATLSDVRIEVDTQSVFSNYAKRDQHLKSADFLNSAEFPRMVFTAAGAKRTGERTFEIAGQLELLGRSQPLTLHATWNKSGPSPIDKTYVMGVSARGSFKRSSYGMNYGVEQRLGRRRRTAHHRVRGQAQVTHGAQPPSAARPGWALAAALRPALRCCSMRC